jgi:hypothetical protein
MNFFADRMKDFAQAARPTPVSQVTSSGNTRSGKGRGEDSPSAARDDRIAFEEFKEATGRTDTDPYGYSGMFYEPGKNRLLGREGGRFGNEGLTQSAIDRINRMSYDQYRGLVSGKGFRKGGQGAPVPGYAPALKLGSETPRGTVVAAPNQPKQGGIFSLSPTLGLLKSLFGGGNIPRVLDDSSPGAINYSSEGIESLMEPYAAPVETSNIAPSLMLVSAQPRKNTNNNLFNIGRFLPGGGLGNFVEDIPDSGIGRFIKRGGFSVGRGTLKPEFNMKDKSFGLTYKMKI